MLKRLGHTALSALTAFAAYTTTPDIPAPETPHQPSRAGVRNMYEAAKANPANIKHWAGVDSLSANASNSPMVRRTLYTRSRYEIANNPEAQGIRDRLAYDTVGTCPRLQISGADPDANRAMEKAFKQWAEDVRLGEKLRTARKAQFQDGETFIHMYIDKRVPGPIKLNVRVIECDQITDGPYGLHQYRKLGKEETVDGLELDEYGNVLKYRMQKYHPGGNSRFSTKTVKIDAADMIHMFKKSRPGQHRGIPEITPALMTFADMRNYCAAVVRACIVNANVTGVVETKNPDNGFADGQDTEDYAFDLMDIAHNQLMVLPDGMTMNEFKSAHPVANFVEFDDQMLRKIGACANMPFNVAAKSSKNYNFSSGKLDLGFYEASIRVERYDLQLECLNRIFDRWLYFATRLDVAEQQRRNIIIPVDFEHSWHYDGLVVVDEQKAAKAATERLKTGQSDFYTEHTLRGTDFDVYVTQTAKAMGKTEDEVREALWLSLFSTGTVNVEPSENEDVVARLSEVVENAVETAVQTAIEELNLEKAA